MTTEIMNNVVELTEEETEFVTGGTGVTAQYYIIQRGDNLTRIARRFATTIKRLMELNPRIINPNKIYAGDRMRVR